MEAIPYRNGKRVRIHRVRKEIVSTFSDMVPGVSVLVSQPKSSANRTAAAT